MDPALVLNDLDPANNFAMGGLPMALARALLLEGKPLPKTLFLDVMVEKTQKLIQHIKNHHLGLALTANICENTAIIRVYDNFTIIKLSSTSHNNFKSLRLRRPVMETVYRG